MKSSCTMLASREFFTRIFCQCARLQYVTAETYSCTFGCSTVIGWRGIFTEVVQVPSPSSNSASSRRFSVNMQSDDLVSSLKTDLSKSFGTYRVLVGVTGSVAALKLPVLVSELLQLPGVSRFAVMCQFERLGLNCTCHKIKSTPSSTLLST